jgi:uncharacterized membrane protein
MLMKLHIFLNKQIFSKLITYLWALSAGESNILTHYYRTVIRNNVGI